MHRIDHPTNALTLPAPSAAGTPGFFQPGNSSLGLSGTIITTDWANTVQEEISNVVTAGGIVLNKADNSQMLAALDNRYAGVAGGIGGFRNAIINGGFDIWQRAISFTNPANAEHVADRWRVIWNGSGATRVISRVGAGTTATALTGRSTILRWSQTAAGTGGTVNSLTQRIEGAGTLSGRTVTVSWVQQSTSTISMASVQLQQVFGSGGSPSAATVIDVATNNPVTSTQVRRSFTVTLPNVAGKVFGTNNDDYLMLRFNLPLNTTFSLDITQVQVEAGLTASAFEMRGAVTEFVLCARYFETSITGINTNPVYSVADGSGEAHVHPTSNFAMRTAFRVQKRAVPTVIVYDSLSAPNRFSCRTTSAWFDGGVVTLGPISAVGGFYWGHSLAGTIETQFWWRADAEI